MLDRGGGVIVNVTSIHETTPRPGFSVYAASKAALGMLTRSFALELAPAIRVVAVAPGAIATRGNEEAESLSPESPARPAGAAGGGRRARLVPLLGRRLVRHGRQLPGRRRGRATRDRPACMGRAPAGRAAR